MTFPPNRVVAFLTPLVFAPLAGAIAAWVANHVPGVPSLDSTQITALFVAGATIAFGKAALWLHGWQIQMQLPARQPAVQRPHPSRDAQAQPASSPNGTAPELEPV